MEGLVLLKTSDLGELLIEIKAVKDELRQLREKEENLKAYSIQEAADLIGLHYSSVRKLVLKKKLHGVYLGGESGKCTIPAWSIKEYLQSKTH